jgi:hypothetical protein
MKCTLTQISVPFSKSLKRQAAPRMVVKSGIQSKKSEQENHRAIESRGTHTTLRCCASGLPGNSQKTGVIGPRAIHRRQRKALCRAYQPYGISLLASYFNGLENRPQLCSLLSGER